jgi:hypothetical protein
VEVDEFLGAPEVVMGRGAVLGIIVDEIVGHVEPVN